MISGVAAVLFDLDGVLLDACDWHYDSLNRALLETVGFEISRDDHIRSFNGLPTKVKLQMLNITDSRFEQILELKQRYTVEEIIKNASLMTEKIELLQFLKESYVKTACVTNSIRNNTEMMLRMTGQLNLIDLIVSNEDVKNNKPAPDCYNFAIDKLGIDPKFAICVEDSDKGYEAAKNSKAARVWRVENAKDVTLQNFRRFIS